MATEADIMAAFAALSSAIAEQKLKEVEVGSLRKLLDEAMVKNAESIRLIDTRRDKLSSMAASQPPPTSPRESVLQALMKNPMPVNTVAAPLKTEPIPVLPTSRDQKRREGGR